MCFIISILYNDDIVCEGGMFKMSTKEEVLKLIEDLPEGVTIEDIMRELYIKSKIDKGIQELNSGKFVSHEQVKEKLEKWLN